MNVFIDEAMNNQQPIISVVSVDVVRERKGGWESERERGGMYSLGKPSIIERREPFSYPSGLFWGVSIYLSVYPVSYASHKETGPPAIAT